MENKSTDSIGTFRLVMIWIAVFNMSGFYLANAQDAVRQYSDSLLNNARSAPTTELKIEGLLGVSIFWIDYDTASAYQYLEEAHELMGKPPSNYHKGLYYLYHANILMDFRPREAKLEFVKADSLLATESTKRSYKYRSKLWNNYGVVLQREDKSAEFMDIVIHKTIPFARLAGDSAQVGYQLQNMAMLMSNLSDYKRASGYYRQALQTMLAVPEREEDRLYIFINAAKNSLFMQDRRQARIYLDSAWSYIQRLPHSATSVPTYYRTELTYFKQLGDKQKVLENYEKGIAAAKNLGNTYLLKDLSFELSTFYRDLGEYKKARKYLVLSNDYQPYSRLQNRALYQKEMARLEYLLGNYKVAYGYMDSLRITMDSIYQKDVATKLLDLEQQYQTKEKENRILRLKTKSKEQELAIAKSRWWEIALGSALVFAVFVAYFWWKIGRNNKKLLLQKELLHEEELRTMRQQERLNQYEAMLQGQESERSRMAKDLHDGLGGLLAGVKLKLSSIVARAGGGNAAQKSAINDVVHQLDYSVDELRRISHNMMPESLRYGGLAPALSDLCRFMNTPSVQIVFQDLDINDTFSDHLRVTVYRIVQELLTNAVKHAKATKIILQCSKLDNWLFITVEDNGIGFEQNENNREKGLGLVNIRNRISLLNGHIETISASGSGTTINIQIPL